MPVSAASCATRAAGDVGRAGGVAAKLDDQPRHEAAARIGRVDDDRRGVRREDERAGEGEDADEARHGRGVAIPAHGGTGPS